jgi:hypothetical protein
MLLAGLGMTVVGMILANTEVLYPATLGVRAFFLVCIVTFYCRTGDPFFLVMLGVVGLGVVLTLSSYVQDRHHDH